MGSVINFDNDLGGKREAKGAKMEPQREAKWVQNRSKIVSKFDVDFECDFGISDGRVGGMAWTVWKDPEGTGHPEFSTLRSRRGRGRRI